MKKTLLTLLILVAILALVLLFRAITYSEPPPTVATTSSALSLATEDAPARLAQAVRYPTVSNADTAWVDKAVFGAFHAFLREAFPLVHEELKLEVINGLSLLYKWEGKDASLRPGLMLAHQDVVPVNDASRDEWDFPPFSGEISNGFIQGRGTLDDKMCLMGILEATEMLLADGVQPQRTLYLGFGHDEEVGGAFGAVAMASMFAEQNIRLAFVLDEGSAVVENVVPGIEEPFALIGISEKGYISVEMTVQGTGGHSSMPPPLTAVGRLSRAITRLQENPFPANLAYVEPLFRKLGDQLPFSQRLVLGNLWLLEPVMVGALSQTASLNANIRTTTAPTMFSSGIKDNVLPDKASAVVNFRILPGETSDDVINYVRQIVDDPSVTVTRHGVAEEPAPVSNSDSETFHAISTTLRTVFSAPQMVVSPSLVVAATDSRHFAEVADDIYRFSPMLLNGDDLKRIHGVNERIAVDNYRRMIEFYYRFMGK